MHAETFDAGNVLRELLWMTVGGAGLGVVLGLATSYCLHSIDDYKVEILLTLALASGGYVLAEFLLTSGPITVAIAGLVIGSQGRLRRAVAVTRRHLFLFWELLDEIMNAVLFMLMGLVLVIITMTTERFVLGLLAIPVLLIARFISVGLPITCIRFFRNVESGTVRLLTWGGLRGGISIALALSLPPMPEKELLLAMTYIVVVFSILVQGMTFPHLVNRFAPKE
jgi:CPA1 family monovalent cation:H+ antiporter